MLALRSALPTLVPSLRRCILPFLRRCFPRVCAGLLEDAVQDAMLRIAADLDDPASNAERAWAGDGEDGLRGLACRVAWRSVRGRLRRKGYRWVGLVAQISGSAQPDELLVARRAANRLGPVLDAVSRRHAPRAPRALLSALVDSLEGDETDAVVAARYGLRREPLVRARGEARVLLAA